MSEQTVTGICTEIAQKPGSEWVEFHIDSGGKYPVKLSTKMSPLIELGRAVGGQLATWTYKETDGNPNPHKPGEFYKNRYLESVEVGGTVHWDESGGQQSGPVQNPTGSVATPETSAQGVTSPARPPVLGGDKDRLIVRQTCIKAASALLHCNDASEDLPLDVMKAAQRFETWCYRDLEPPPF